MMRGAAAIAPGGFPADDALVDNQHVDSGAREPPAGAEPGDAATDDDDGGAAGGFRRARHLFAGPAGGIPGPGFRGPGIPDPGIRGRRVDLPERRPLRRDAEPDVPIPTHGSRLVSGTQDSEGKQSERRTRTPER